MKNPLRQLIDSSESQSIESVHRIQQNLYGIYLPPSPKQLMSLRYLLLSTGSLAEVDSEMLLGLSKVECSVLLKKLNRIYLARRRNHA